MGPKERDEKRNRFRNLKCVIIDEISFVSSDMFYNIDLRLREITQVERPFGNVAVFVFGDLFQLRPVNARFVFQAPKDRNNLLSFTARSLWRMFTVINLEENHRQGEDRAYADLLNRVREGLHTEEDLEVLETRVRKEDDEELKELEDV